MCTAQVPKAGGNEKRSRNVCGAATVQRPSRSTHRGQKHHSKVARWRGTTFMYCATPMHTTLHANNLTAEPSTCRRTSGTAVESSPQKTSTPVQVLCDRLRPSKNCRLNSFQSTAQIIDRKLPVSPFVVAKLSAPPDNANETALPCTAIAQVAQQAPA